MSGRQIFSESERLCLQELVIKYNLDCKAAGNSASKKKAWAHLVQEFNLIESNSVRTETQLKKCWDNLKTRKKALLVNGKNEQMRTGGGSLHSKPGSSMEDSMLVFQGLLHQTNEELRYVVDSNNLPTDSSQEIPYLEMASNTDSEPGPLSESVAYTDPETERDTRGRPGTDSATGQQTPGTVKNDIFDVKVINEVFQFKKNTYARLQEREEELHRLAVEEKRWLIKAAKEMYKRTVIERQNAEELLHRNRAKKKEAKFK